MPQLSQAQLQAAGPLVDLVAATLGQAGKEQMETVVAASARLSGSMLLRSFQLGMDHLEPGSVLLSEQANTMGPSLVAIAKAILGLFGLAVDPAGGRTKGRGQDPELTFLETMELLQDPALAIARDHHLSLEETAQAAAAATGFIVKACASSMDLEIAFNAAVYGFVEGTKTVPPRLAVRP